MRTAPAAGAVALLLILLSWLSFQALNTEAETFDHALNDLDRFTMAQAALQRDVLTARAGLLRNYDRLVQDGGALDGSLAQLRKDAGGDAPTVAAIDNLASSVLRQEDLVERFKSDNALLQNSLAYFGLFSERLVAPGQPARLASAVSALAAAMLHLTLDTSAEAAGEVQRRLNELAAPAYPPEQAQSASALLAHGKLLHDLLPTTDALLRRLSTLPRQSDRQAVRDLLLKRQLASRDAARIFRLFLYAVSLLLLGLLVYLGLQLRERALLLKRRATFEHMIADISMRFVSARPQEIGAHIERALAEIARFFWVDRAYFLISGPTPRLYAWHREGMAFPPGWPEGAVALEAKVNAKAKELTHIIEVERIPPGEIRDALRGFGLKGWACIATDGGDGIRHFFGVDAVRQACQTRRLGPPGLLRMSFDTLCNAATRMALQQEHARLEARLRQAQRMETVGALTSGIAHNFNNIIGAILGYAEMAQAQLAPGSRAARNIDEIGRAGERARDLIDRILTFGRRRDIRRSLVNIGSLIDDAAALLRASLPSGINLVVHDTPNDAVVPGEQVQLQQIILNLCTNAAQAMDGSGRIEVDAEMRIVAQRQTLSHGTLLPGRHVRIAVSDVGRGMDDATLGRIFEPFFTTRLTGNGLGLATVREIVREHGGAMDVWSAPSRGSRFEVWLPCCPSIESAVAAEGAPLRLGQGETLILVDANRERRLKTEEVLAALGYEPVGFATAEEALAACRASPRRFDALMLSLLAPVASALDLAAAFHRHAPDLPIVLATARAGEVEADALVAAGVAEIVHLPVVTMEIAEALGRCVARSRMQPQAGVKLIHAGLTAQASLQ